MTMADEGIELPLNMKILSGKLPKKSRGLMTLDPTCLSCTKMRADIIKHFKMACIAYAPSTVVFRNIEFKRSQILVFRKFLMGQCSKIVHLKEPYKSLAMSTKRIFDDMYLYLKELNIKSLEKDPLNDMPANSYEDMAARYWNLIYKDQVPRSPN